MGGNHPNIFQWGSETGLKRIKALQSHRTDSGNDFACSSTNIHFQSNSYRWSFSPPTMKQLSSERAPLKQQNNTTVTAKIKAISKSRVITQMWISCLFPCSDLMRLENLCTPHIPRTHIHTRQVVVTADTSPCIGITGLFRWKNRAQQSPLI